MLNRNISSKLEARGAADRSVESLLFQVSIVRRLRFQILPKPARGLLGQKTWCDRQQLWKVVITGDTVTRLSIPIRGLG